MRLPLLAIAAACALPLARTPPTIAAEQPQRPPADLGALYRQPPLDAVSMAFAYDRMTGLSPDFRQLAERSDAARAATAFDRDEVIDREVARYRAAFQAFDLGKVYDARFSTELQQYSAGRGGYTLALGEDTAIQLFDPVTMGTYHVQFRNIGDVTFIPFGDAAAARAFAARNSLEMQAPFAGDAVLQVAFRLAEAPPVLASDGPSLVWADILAARVMSRAGAVLHDFGLTRAALSAPASPGTEPAGLPVLKAADVRGLRIGMPQDEADAVASRGWTTKRGSQQAGHVLWFNDLQQAPGRSPDRAARQGDWAVCGNLADGAPPEMDDPMAGASPPPYKDCIGYGFGRVNAGGDARGDRVGRVVAVQFLAGSDTGAPRRALEEKYGKPAYVRDRGSDLVWVGHDPANPDGEPVVIEARLDVGGIRLGEQIRVAIRVSMARYVDPRRLQPAAVPAVATGGPRL